jgi:hypothetical protein
VFNATLSITDDAPGSPQLIPVTATATDIELQPRELKFRLVEPGQVTPSQTISITNVGSAPVTISSVATTGHEATEFVIQSSTCPQVLSAAASCALQVAFAPTVEGKATAAVTVTDDDPASPQRVVLLGDGTDVLLTPAVLNFGTLLVGKGTSPQPITVTNSGTTDVTISGISIQNANAPVGFVMTGNNCPTVLTAGANCTIDVVFSASVKTTYSGHLMVSDSDPGSPQTVQFIGKGIE